MNPTTETAVQHLVQLFEQLQPQDVSRLSALYAPEARFKDPFNDVRGLPEIESVEFCFMSHPMWPTTGGTIRRLREEMMAV